MLHDTEFITESMGVKPTENMQQQSNSLLLSFDEGYSPSLCVWAPLNPGLPHIPSAPLPLEADGNM
jgi:hypothetical protein